MGPARGRCRPPAARGGRQASQPEGRQALHGRGVQRIARQVEGFVDWTMPEDQEFSDYPRLNTEGKKKILGLNAAKLYGIDVPEEFRLPDEAGTPAAKEDAQLVSDTP